MKRITIVLVCMCLILSGCTNNRFSTKKQYQATFLSLFDTVTTIVGKAESEEEFQKQAQAIRDDLQMYHELFDIYHDYEGISNIKTINDNAGVKPVVVDPIIIEFLKDCKEFYKVTDQVVNVAMGSVLELWHDARTDGMRDPQNSSLPDMGKLKEASNHINFETVVIDEEASTVYISDPECSLDVGAIAKGWATQKAAEKVTEGMLISVGGNVCATGPKDEKGTPWVIGIQDPDNSNKNLHTIYVKSGSVVTSGDYQRYYVVNGEKYHHIIDPKTQMPSTYWKSVTIVCEDSGTADALSTALFLLPLEEGKALLELYDAQAIWVDTNGKEYMTPGFKEIIRS